MRLSRSLIALPILLILVAVACYFAARSCNRTLAPSKERDLARWQGCTACGHLWRGDLEAIVQERMQDPFRRTVCPECGEREGVPVWECLGCGRLIPKFTKQEADDGSVAYVRCYYCDTCAEERGGESGEAATEMGDNRYGPD